jgi:hypothetical protein
VRREQGGVVPFRPEVELLLGCARTRLDAERAARVRALARQDLDWQYLRAVALRNRVAPLIARHLSGTCAESVPPEVLDRLRNDVQVSVRHNLLLTAELVALLELCAEAGIPALPYKGPALAAAVYDNLALRQFGDLDLLVHRADVPRARALLAARGYVPLLPLPAHRQAAALGSEYDEEFVSADGRVHLELHWELVPRYFAFRLDVESLRVRLQTTSLGQTRLPTFAPEDLLLILCVHGAKHLWERLVWVCDVAELLARHPEVDWERALDQAAQLGAERMVLLGLFLASRLLGAELPDRISRRAASDPLVRALASNVCRRLFGASENPPGFVETSLFYLRVRERLRDRARYCLASIAPTASDSALLPLPGPLAFLYVLLRPFRLAGKWGLGLWPELPHRDQPG